MRGEEKNSNHKATQRNSNSPSERPGSLGQEVRGGLVVVERGERAGQGGQGGQGGEQEAGEDHHLVLQPPPHLAGVKQMRSQLDLLSGGNLFTELLRNS